MRSPRPNPMWIGEATRPWTSCCRCGRLARFTYRLENVSSAAFFNLCQHCLSTLRNLLDVQIPIPRRTLEIQNKESFDREKEEWAEYNTMYDKWEKEKENENNIQT